MLYDSRPDCGAKSNDSKLPYLQWGVREEHDDTFSYDIAADADMVQDTLASIRSTTGPERRDVLY